jgi:hypothetical protein
MINLKQMIWYQYQNILLLLCFLVCAVGCAPMGMVPLDHPA